MDLTALRISPPFSSFSSIILRYCLKSFCLSSLSLSKTPRNSQVYTLKVNTSCRASKDGVVFDDAAYEVARLSLDAKARESMAEASEREVNVGVGVGVKQVLRYAPCSVEILVDRGFGSTRISRSSVSINIAVVFIGGKDDRKALPFVGRMARHPGVSVIRFMFDLNKESSVSTRL